MLSTVETSKTAISNALSAANAAVNTAWLASYDKVIRISSNLEANLNYHAQRNLEYSRFQYYTGLWFRSMLAADIVYKEYQDIQTSYQALNNLIVSIKNGRNVGMPRQQVYLAKDSLKELTRVFLERVRELNSNTATLRDKVGRECGNRGRQWVNERMRNRT